MGSYLFISHSLGTALDDITVERVAVGLFFTGVKLSTGHAGACATPVKEIPDAVCCPSSVAAMPFPGKLRGRRAVDLLDEATERVGIRRTLVSRHSMLCRSWRMRGGWRRASKS
ncbi:DUF4213 domain-containing proteins [Rhizobiaceae sp. 2RAB30]